MQVDIEKLKARAARHSSKHVQRFEPLIETVIKAMAAAGLTVEQRYENQVTIQNRWIGRYEHTNKTTETPARIVIYDRPPASPRGTLLEPRVEIRNAAEAKLFACTLRWASEILDPE